jgi:hypothetical protein
MQFIPFKSPSQWQEQINLDGQDYVLSFAWNALNEYWAMEILTRDLEPIVLGIKIVVNYNLTYPYVAEGIPPGDIVCQNLIGGDAKIKRYDMGDVTELVYYSAGEFDA